MAFSKNLIDPAMGPAKKENSLQGLAKDIQQMVGIILPCKKRHFKASDLKLPSPIAEDDLFLYGRHPILCRFIAFRAKLLY